MKTTKQILFAALITFLSAIAAQAQVALGLKVGSNFGTVHTTETLGRLSPDFKYAPGWTVGGIAEINFGKYFALQPEVNWMQKGFRFDEAFDIPVGKINIPAGAEATVRTNYVEVPLLAKVKLGNDRVQAYAVLGPSFGYGLNGKIITRTRLLFELDPINTNLNFDQLDYNRFEVSGTGGLGVQFNFNGVKVFGDARYTHGFTELYNFPIVNEQIKNRGFAVSTGVALDLGSAKPKKKYPPIRRP